VAGTAALVEQFGTLLARARELEGHLEVVAELGDEEERERLQELVDQVGGRWRWRC
jgi:malonyl CoA-acyl carrier protein transacylase